jgi:hypothetical protein
MPRARRWVFGAVVALLLGVSPLTAGLPAGAAPLSVCSIGCQFTSIAAALAAAKAGDTIAVGPGTYAGGLVVDKSIKLIGAGANQTIVHRGGGDTGGSVVQVAAGTVAAISRVTLEGGITTNGGGLRVLDGGSLILDAVIIRQNIAESGGAIYNQGRLSAIAVAILDNTAFVGGGIVNEADLSLTRSDVSLNRAIIAGAPEAATGGGIVNRRSGRLTLGSTVVSGNVAMGAGGGIHNAGQALLQGSAVSKNTADLDGAGILNLGQIAIGDGTVNGNVAGRHGGGLLTRGDDATWASVSLARSRLVDNRAVQGAGIWVERSGLGVSESTISGNAASGAGGGIYAPGVADKTSLVVLSKSAVTGNTPENCRPLDGITGCLD